RGLKYPGWCVGWWVQYQHVAQDGSVDSYVDVDVTLYRTAAQTLAPCHEPAFGLYGHMGDGGQMNFLPGTVVSIIRNVIIFTTSSYGSGDVPNHAGGPDFSDPAQMKI